MIGRTRSPLPLLEFDGILCSHAVKRIVAEAEAIFWIPFVWSKRGLARFTKRARSS